MSQNRTYFMRRRKSQVPVSVSAWTKPPPAISTGGWNCVPFYQLHWVQIFIQSILLCFKECIFMWIEKTAKTTSHFHFIFYVLSQVTLYFCVLFYLLSSIINTSICRDYTILPKICFSNLNYTFSLPHVSVPNLSLDFLSSLQLFFFFFFPDQRPMKFFTSSRAHGIARTFLCPIPDKELSLLFTASWENWQYILPVPAAPPGLRPQFGDVSIFSFLLFPISFCCSPRIPRIPTFA